MDSITPDSKGVAGLIRDISSCEKLITVDNWEDIDISWEDIESLWSESLSGAGQSCHFSFDTRADDLMEGGITSLEIIINGLTSVSNSTIMGVEYGSPENLLVHLLQYNNVFKYIDDGTSVAVKHVPYNDNLLYWPYSTLAIGLLSAATDIPIHHINSIKESISGNTAYYGNGTWTGTLSALTTGRLYSIDCNTQIDLSSLGSRTAMTGYGELDSDILESPSFNSELVTEETMNPTTLPISLLPADRRRVSHYYGYFNTSTDKFNAIDKFIAGDTPWGVSSIGSTSLMGDEATEALWQVS